MKKIVLRLELQDDKAKHKALKTVAGLQGIDSIAMDMKEKRLTVTGVVDPVSLVKKLRKYWPDTAMMLVGPAKEPEKPKEEAKPDATAGESGDGKKEDGQGKGSSGDEKDPAAAAEEGKKEGDGKKEEEEEEEDKIVSGMPFPLPPDPVLEMVKAYKAYNPHMTTYYYVPSMEENPNACAIS